MIPTTVFRTARVGFSLSRGSTRLLSTRFGKICLAHRAHDGTHTQLRLVRDVPGSVDRLASEQVWLAHLTTRHHLAVPLPRPWRDGTLISPQLTHHDGSHWHASAYSWVAGRHLNGGLNAAEMRRAGAFIARMHRANDDAPTGLADRRPVWWIPRLFELASTLRDLVHERVTLPSGVSPAIAAELRRTHDALVSAHAALPVGANYSGLIHTDAHWQNLRFLQQRVGMVDFEDFATGRFMLDIACLWGKVEERPHSERLLDAILDGYDRVSPLPEQHRRDLHVMLAFRRFDYAGWVLSWPRLDLHAWGPGVLRDLGRYVDRHLASS